VKNILIISYFFPPANFVASNRPQAFAANLKQHGLNPVVLTRHWTGNERNWSDMDQINKTAPEITEEESFTVIRVPYHSRPF
jgi:hypothetical protein